MSSKGSCSKMNMMAYMPWIKLIIALGLIICFVIIASTGDATATTNDTYMRNISMLAVALCVASVMYGAYALFAVWCLAIGVYYVNNGHSFKTTNKISDNIRKASIVAILLSTLGVVLHSGDLWMSTQKFGK